MKPTRTHVRPAMALMAVALALTTARGAKAEEAEQPAPFKLTTGVYRLSGGGAPSGQALDVNLRHTSDLGNVWIGWFRSPVLQFTQTRVGWDRTFASGPVRVMPSVQAATGGYWAASFTAETGSTWFAGAGIGRSNLRPSVALNFDPGEAWALSGGYRWEDNSSVALQLIRDNRENPDQRHLHLIWRQTIEGGERLTVDLLAKQGLVAGENIRRVGFTMGYDWRRHFVRIAWDPNTSFTPQDMLRVSAGVRF
jgi:hypothetical protein